MDAGVNLMEEEIQEEKSNVAVVNEQTAEQLLEQWKETDVVKEDNDTEEVTRLVHDGRPLKFQSVEELEAKAEEYFKSCWVQKVNAFGDPIYEKDKDGKKIFEKPVMVQFKPYTITGLAVFLDTSRKTLLDYENSHFDSIDEESKKRFSNAIKKLKEKCHAYAEEQLFLNRQATGAIFNLKNNYDWKDEQQIDHSFIKTEEPKIRSDV